MGPLKQPTRHDNGVVDSSWCNSKIKRSTSLLDALLGVQERCADVKRGRGRPNKVIDNAIVFDFLQGFQTYREAVQTHSWVDDILVGVANLDIGGNTRGLCKRLLYRLLRNFPMIDSLLVQQVAYVGARQAQKICSVLRIAQFVLKREILKNSYSKES